MSLKSTIKKYQREGESLRTTAKRLISDNENDVGTKAAKTWLTNKAWKPARKNAPVKAPEPVASTTSKPRKK